MTIIPDNAKKTAKKRTFFKTLKPLHRVSFERFLSFLAVFKNSLENN